MGHDPQPRVGQASDQAITVNDRVDVAHHAARTDPGKGTLTGPSDSRVTHHAADNANPAGTSPRPAATNTYRRITPPRGLHQSDRTTTPRQPYHCSRPGPTQTCTGHSERTQTGRLTQSQISLATWMCVSSSAFWLLSITAA